MLRLLSYILFVSACMAQSVVMLKPVLKYGGKQIWSVSIKSDSSNPQTISREAIMQLVPQIHELPNDISEDIMIRAAARQPANFAQKIWNVLAPPGAAAAAGLAIASKTNGPVYISAGIELVSLGVNLFSQQGVNPEKYFQELLPENVSLPAAPSGATYGVVSDYSKNMITLGPYRLDQQGDLAEQIVINHRLAMIKLLHKPYLKGGY